LKFTTEELDGLRESGEENAGGIAAMGKAMIILKRIGLDIIAEEEQALTKQLIRGLKQIHKLKIYGIQDENPDEFSKRGGVVSFSIDNAVSTGIAEKLAYRGGIGVRGGCHCAHILIKHLLKIPPFVQKLQKVIVTLFPNMELPGVVRVSLGIENTEQDIDEVINALKQIRNKPQPNHKRYNLAMIDICKEKARVVFDIIS
jgi:selenocysteine lyase/cysteine desulfurase